MKRTFPLVTVIGALVVILIVTGATLWMSSGARSATDQAVDMVSDFYLEELAGRRSQVVSRFFETKADQMERAVSLMSPQVLASQDPADQVFPVFAYDHARQQPYIHFKRSPGSAGKW